MHTMQKYFNKMEGNFDTWSNKNECHNHHIKWKLLDKNAYHAKWSKSEKAENRMISLICDMARKATNEWGKQAKTDRHRQARSGYPDSRGLGKVEKGKGGQIYDDRRFNFG